MKISTKGRYGLEAIVDLAMHSTQGCVNIKSISGRCGISEAYILQIFLELRRAGIVDSIRGAQGGYILVKDPSKITVKTVLNVLEGPLAPVACLAQEEPSCCDRYERCVTIGFWEGIMHIMNDTAESVTIKDLVEYCHRTQTEDIEIDYFI